MFGDIIRQKQAGPKIVKLVEKFRVTTEEP